MLSSNNRPHRDQLPAGCVRTLKIQCEIFFFACDRRGGVAETSEKAFAKENGRQAQADEAVVVVAA